MNMPEGLQVFSGRDTLENKCKNGHFSPLFARFCIVCGEPTDKKFGYHDWSGINIDMQQLWQHITDWNELSDRVYFSYFDERLLLINSKGGVLFIDSVLRPPEQNRIVSAFSFGNGVQQITQVITLNSDIYLLAMGDVWRVCWLDLVQQQLQINCLPSPGITFQKIMSFGDKLYALSESTIFEIQGTQSPKPVYRLPEGERVLDVVASSRNICVITRNEIQDSQDQAAINIRTQHLADPSRLCEPIMVKMPRNDQLKCSAGCGKIYYAFSLGDENVVAGRFSSLQANSIMRYDIKAGMEVEHLFFLDDNLYAYGHNQLKVWDCAAYNGLPKKSLDGANLAKMNAGLSRTDHKLLLPIKQNNADYIALFDSRLLQLSISRGFNEQLIAMDVLDNHIFAVFQTDNKLRLFMG